MSETIENCNKITYITPWKNSAEFLEVYSLLFGDNANIETKQKAFTMMTIWKIRRAALTPASVLSTLALLEVDIKSEININLNEIQIMYSNAFTRFLNFMTSIMQVKQFKTLYKSTSALGLESFLVDLRHMCAHGQTMPSVDVLLRTSKYCMKWLKDFYWDQEINNLKKLTTNDIRKAECNTFMNEINELFNVYDLTNEALYKGFDNVKEIKKNFGNERKNTIIKYSKKISKDNLNEISKNIIKRIENVIEKQKTLKNKTEIICYVLLNPKYSRFFLESLNPIESIKFIKLYQPLFRTFANFGLIDELLKQFICLIENPNENHLRRESAIFWTEKLIQGILHFREFKKYIKHQMETTKYKFFDLSTINSDEHNTKKLQRICDYFEVNSDDSLLFCDTLQYRIDFDLTNDFLKERILNADDISINFIKNCINASGDDLSDDNKEKLIKLIDIYCNGSTAMDDSTTGDDDEMNGDDCEMDVEKTIPIWRTAPRNFAWSTIPLGANNWKLINS